MMDWKEAILKSKKESCFRVEYTRRKKIPMTTVKYPNGTGYVLIGEKDHIDYFLSHPADEKELEGFNDWEPSK